MQLSFLFAIQLLDEYFIGRMPFRAGAGSSAADHRNFQPVVSPVAMDKMPMRVGEGGWPMVGYSTGTIRGMRVRGVDHIIIADLVSIHLPIRNMLAIRAPQESIAARQLLFIYPVERSIEQFASSAWGEGLYFTGSQRLQVQVLFADIRYA